MPDNSYWIRGVGLPSIGAVKISKANMKHRTEGRPFAAACGRRPLESPLPHSLWMNTMNRCNPPWSALILVALCAVLAPAAAQEPVQTQNEAALGGRNFPIGTLRGRFMVVNSPEIELDGERKQLSPGAQIRSAQRMLVMPAYITGQNLLVNYKLNADGMVTHVWILTPEEAQAKRESAEKPFLNFWPFVADTGPRDDGKTPFDQLPRYGQ